MATAVAKRYARAVFELVLEQGETERVDSQSQFLEGLFSDPAVRKFFESPRIPAERKKQVAEKQLASAINSTMLKLVMLLIDKRRIDHMAAIMHEYDVLTDIHRGVEEVSIVSAIPLSDELQAAIVSEVRRFTSYSDLRVSNEVDTGVLGGIKVKLGENLVIDGTVTSKLSQLREQLYHYRHSGIGA